MMKPSSKTNKFMGSIILALLILMIFALSGFTIAIMAPETVPLANPNNGDETPSEQVNVIKNGDFEQWDQTNELHGIALDWEGYHNGQAIFGYYNEQWPEAVLDGGHAQLLEINMVEANRLDRVIAIFQTVNVQPNVQYDLRLYAIMRSQAPERDRNNNEFEMHWGLDYSGTGNYDNVQEWHLMPLTEQYRLGSSGQYPEDIPLFYEMITGTVATGDSGKVTLFIRGLKKFSTGTEVNFDIDNVSLMGPAAGGSTQPQPTAQPTTEPGSTPAATPTPNQMPPTGAIRPENLSLGAVLLGGLVLVILGTTAAASLLKNREE